MVDADNFDAAEHWIDDWQSEIEKQAARTQALAARFAEVNGSARSADGLVEVLVDSTGGMTDLHLDEGIRRHSAQHTAGEILSTVAAARAAMAERAAAAVAETVGHDSETGKAILASFQRLTNEVGRDRG
jgi:hypothetical protein